MVRHFLVLPIIEQDFRIGSSMYEWQFALLCVAVLLIAAAGYLINNYFDVGIDRINKPNSSQLGGLTLKQAERWYVTLNLVAIFIGLFVAYQVGNYRLVYIFITVTGLLYLYSKVLKKIPLLGNVLVALVTAMVVSMPIFFEEPSIFSSDPLYLTAGKYLWWSAGVYFVFAFFGNLAREVVKDLEDMRGDELGGRFTIPVAWGEKSAKFIAIFILLLLVRALLFVQQKHIIAGSFDFPIYTGILIDLPAVVAMIMIYRANTTKDYHRISQLLKAIILLGILSMPLYDGLVIGQ
ncbi:MAG: geranylgeranylglycerol-phosphate geranylgeranyltransferase [Chitinophagales bacterium]|nr:geranylgeranylglycerol-phosphate geranylgeranyltransferase [Chitinophagales bacterium]